MDVIFLRKAFALIAKGLIEKERLFAKEPARYPYSKTLQHGINMFLTASVQAGSNTVARCADEHSFLEHYITLPVANWFQDWTAESLERLNLADEPFYACEALAYRMGAAMYMPSSECYDFLKTVDSDLVDGTDEKALYEKMAELKQELYCRVRRFIIENPIITLEERRNMSLELAADKAARDAFQFAYEEIPKDCYRCPNCGWTMTVGKYGFHCHSKHCTDTLPKLTEEMKLDASTGELFRLKRGVMRYFAAPGKLELEIADFCEKKKLRWVLWPQMDRYDVEIQFSDGEIWEIDAKAYRNPLSLRAKIQNDGGFPEGEYARGYYAVPTEYTKTQQNYTAVVNRALEKQKNVKCVTMHSLKEAISKKEAACGEK